MGPCGVGFAIYTGVQMGEEGSEIKENVEWHCKQSNV